MLKFGGGSKIGGIQKMRVVGQGADFQLLVPWVSSGCCSDPPGGELDSFRSL